MPTTPISLSESAVKAQRIFQHALRAVDAYVLTKEAICLENDILMLAESPPLPLDAVGNIYVVGAGKAASSMAKAVEDVLGERITAGAITTKYQHSLPLNWIEITEAAHPVPDANGLEGTRKIMDILKQTQANDLVLVLLSGGGSALLADVPPGCTLTDVQQCVEALLKSGAAIEEMNTVRKHLSKIKGGQMVRMAAPARVVSFIISDVIGDRLDVIASGPTVADTTTFADVWQVIETYQLAEKLPATITHYLKQGMEGGVADTPKPFDAIFEKTATILIGNNTKALEAAASQACKEGYTTYMRTHELCGEAREQAARLVAEAKAAAVDSQIPKPCCLLYGGETTVTIHGTGKGGRNQELALATALLLDGVERITLLSAGTDGTDGPTDVAGAWVDGHTLARGGISAEKALDLLTNNDSYTFFTQAGGHIRTGATHTNVMDIIIIIIE